MKCAGRSLGLGAALLSASPLAAAACWVPVPAANSIVFNTTQAGAPFQGQFTQFSGLICLAQSAGKHGLVQVQVQTVSVNTGLPELDEALRGWDFFAVSRWPQASFVSDSVKELAAHHYQVTGKLSLRDVTREITVPFSVTPGADGGAQLEGMLDFERLDYHIGLGQWSDTRWVGNQVEVKFFVRLKPAGENLPAAQGGRRLF